MKNWSFLVGLLLTLVLLWPLFISPYFSHHDDVQVIRLYELDKCVKDFQIPCRWVPDLGGLYGYPLFNYYGPLPYYYGEIFYLLTHNLLISVKIMFATSFIGSFIFMYLLARKFWGNLGGSLAAILYSYAPYHAVDFYVRGAMAEMWGLMLIPAILWAFVKLSERVNISSVLLSSVLLALLALSHNLTLLMFLPVCLVWIFLLYIKNKQAKFLWSTLMSFILAIMLSSFYLLPMIVEKELVHVDTTTFGYFSYTEHFKGLRKLFLDRSWGWGSSFRETPGGPKEQISYQIGFIHVALWILALISIRFLWKRQRWQAALIVFSTIAIMLDVFMIHPKSEFVWKMIEPLKYIQFPWRFLTIVIVFVSLVSGSILTFFNQKKILVWWIVVILVVGSNIFYFRPEKFIQTNDQKLLTGKDWDRQIKRSIFDFLPIFAKEPPAELATSRYQILTGDTKITNFSEGSNWFRFNAETKTHTIIRLSQYYFPNWKVYVDDQEIKIEYKNNSLGLITFILGKGNHSVYAKLYDTQIRILANLITIVGLVLVLLLFSWQFRAIKKWVSYYRRGIN